jgi:hypothetical protein
MRFFSQFVGRKGSRVQGFKGLFSNDIIKAFSILSTSPIFLSSPVRLFFPQF